MMDLADPKGVFNILYGSLYVLREQLVMPTLSYALWF
jgi:hypothetical protein